MTIIQQAHMANILKLVFIWVAKNILNVLIVAVLKKQ